MLTLLNLLECPSPGHVHFSMLCLKNNSSLFMTQLKWLFFDCILKALGKNLYFVLGLTKYFYYNISLTPYSAE